MGRNNPNNTRREESKPAPAMKKNFRGGRRMNRGSENTTGPLDSKKNPQKMGARKKDRGLSKVIGASIMIDDGEAVILLKRYGEDGETYERVAVAEGVDGKNAFIYSKSNEIEYQEAASDDGYLTAGR